MNDVIAALIGALTGIGLATVIRGIWNLISGGIYWYKNRVKPEEVVELLRQHPEGLLYRDILHHFGCRSSAIDILPRLQRDGVVKAQWEENIEGYKGLTRRFWIAEENE